MEAMNPFIYYILEDLLKFFSLTRFSLLILGHSSLPLSVRSRGFAFHFPLPTTSSLRGNRAPTSPFTYSPLCTLIRKHGYTIELD